MRFQRIFGSIDLEIIVQSFCWEVVGFSLCIGLFFLVGGRCSYKRVSSGGCEIYLGSVTLQIRTAKNFKRQIDRITLRT
jgi:hypothetical protein